MRPDSHTATNENAGAEIPLSDRLPTFHELASFDTSKAWDRLSPEQQREIGVITLGFGTIGQCEGYFHENIEGVRKGFNSSHWTPQVQATSVWPRLHIELVESAARAAFEALCEHFDPLWPQLFGWQARREVKNHKLACRHQTEHGRCSVNPSIHKFERRHEQRGRQLANHEPQHQRPRRRSIFLASFDSDQPC
ncbi:hypothetical protein IVA80_10185 [Bradyrhizobium sp. 139]|uniref:hypothetical protein n=1 Tax=Bradyrhizobium sp. 139 TaxID=2782616 RepID=UPI001FFBFA37|nr:hypothetical protein [Bradyrhizobium sp. 139]MCK1741228.1 hypothetical protein [Bradyrhizobium sp. 139]